MDFGDDTQSRVSKDTNFDTLNYLQNTLKSKCPDLLSRKLCLLYDTKHHTTHLIKFLLKVFKWKMFVHCPYLPDLGPSNYLLFPRLKKEFGG